MTFATSIPSDLHAGSLLSHQYASGPDAAARPRRCDSLRRRRSPLAPPTAFPMPGVWTQGAMARDARAAETRRLARLIPAAVRWCLVGAHPQWKLHDESSRPPVNIIASKAIIDAINQNDIGPLERQRRQPRSGCVCCPDCRRQP